MTVFVTLVLAVLSFVFIAYPLFKQRSPAADAVEDDKMRELYSKRDTTYSMLKELEFDFQSGILTEEDYRELEERYKGKAISILRDTDTLEKGTSVEAEIEQQVLGLRRDKGQRKDEEIEQQILELRRDKGRFCPQCGARCQESDRFCPSCGTKLKQGENLD